MRQKLLASLIVGAALAAPLTDAASAAEGPHLVPYTNRPARPARRTEAAWSVKTPEPAEVAEHVGRAKTAAGRVWAREADYFCNRDGGLADTVDDPAITPQKIFDNVWILGNASNVPLIIKTSAGLVMIDNFYPQGRDAVVLAAFKALKLDPADVKYIFVTHGHADHYGSSGWFQQRYGTKVVLSDLDWKMIEGQTGATTPPDNVRPKREIVAEDLKPITVGDFTITPVFIPGHTPGSLGYIFPVKDQGQTHMAAMYGSSTLFVESVPRANLEQSIASMAHFTDAAVMAGVDVELQNHPLFDDMWVKTAALGARAQNGGKNPFVVGRDGYRDFMTVMSECFKADLARRE